MSTALADATSRNPDDHTDTTLVVLLISESEHGQFAEDVAAVAEDDVPKIVPVTQSPPKGPGLELEMETDRFGPVGTTLFLDFFAYKVLGDRTVVLADTATYTDALGGPDEYAARWSATVDPWIFRAGLGMRFQWLGSDK